MADKLPLQQVFSQSTVVPIKVALSGATLAYTGDEVVYVELSNPGYSPSITSPTSYKYDDDLGIALITLSASFFVPIDVEEWNPTTMIGLYSNKGSYSNLFIIQLPEAYTEMLPGKSYTFNLGISFQGPGVTF